MTPLTLKISHKVAQGLAGSKNLGYNGASPLSTWLIAKPDYSIRGTGAYASDVKLIVVMGSLYPGVSSAGTTRFQQEHRDPVVPGEIPRLRLCLLL